MNEQFTVVILCPGCLSSWPRVSGHCGSWDAFDYDDFPTRVEAEAWVTSHQAGLAEEFAANGYPDMKHVVVTVAEKELYLQALNLKRVLARMQRDVLDVLDRTAVDVIALEGGTAFRDQKVGF